MALHSFGTGDRPNFDAMLEQACMLSIIGHNSPAHFNDFSLAVGGVTYIQTQLNTRSWPPVFACYRQGNNIFLTVYGSQNFNHWLGNVVGTFYGVFSSTDTRLHTFFQIACTIIYESLRPVLPPDASTCDWHCSGHSMGAAAALCVAMKIKRDNLGRSSEWIGFGAPRCVAGVTPPEIPDFRFMFATDTDRVVKLPPPGVTGLGKTQVPQPLLPIGYRWRHPYPIGELAANGNLTPRTDADYGTFSAAFPLNLDFSGHFMDTYWARVKNLWQITNNSAQGQAIKTIGDNAITDGPTITPPSVVSYTDEYPYSYVNQNFFENGHDLPITPSNLTTLENLIPSQVVVANAIPIFFGVNPMPTIPTYKSTFMFEDIGQDQGWSESYYHVGTMPTGAAADTMIDTYVTARLAMSGFQTFFIRGRLSTFGARFPVWFRTAADRLAASLGRSGTFAVPAGVDPGSDDPDSAFMMSKVTATTTGRVMFRGIPDCWFTAGGQFGVVGGFVAAFNNFKAVVTGGNPEYGILSGTVPVAGSPATIVLATQDADGRVTFTLNNAIFPNTAPTRAKYIVTIRNQEQPRTLNGNLMVTSLGGVQCSSLKQLPLGNFQAGMGQMLRKDRQYQRITDLRRDAEARSRRSGRPFGQQAGRRRPARSI